jgi:hypothetical protein
MTPKTYTFDEVAKTLARGFSRRDALRRFGGGLAGAALVSMGAGRAFAQSNGATCASSALTNCRAGGERFCLRVREICLRFAGNSRPAIRGCDAAFDRCSEVSSRNCNSRYGCSQGRTCCSDVCCAGGQTCLPFPSGCGNPHPPPICCSDPCSNSCEVGPFCCGFEADGERTICCPTFGCILESQRAGCPTL